MVRLVLLCLGLVIFAQAASITTPAVTFSNVVYSTTLGATSFRVNFQQVVSALNDQHLQLVNTGTGATISLSGSTYTPISGGLSWTVAKPTGFYPSSPNAQLTISFINVPPTICKAPIAPAIVTNATTIVGTGTPASCTEAAFTAAVAAGGIITFNCGSSPVTITVTSVKNVTLLKDTIIDGKGLITLSGGGTTRILAIQTTYDKKAPRVTVQNLAFTGGYTTDAVNTKSTVMGGGALYRLGGAFSIINCDFSDNKGPLTGQDVAGGAVYSVGGADTTIVGSTFSGNMASNGGAIGNLGNSFVIYNSVVNANNATGTGANPGNGGNAGGLCFDGKGVYTDICGSTVSYNSAGALGGALFRVGYQYTDLIFLTNSTFANNSAVSSAGGIYVQGLSVDVRNSTIMFNTAPSGAGIYLQVSANFSLSGVTVANNTATTSLGGGIAIGSGAVGTISDTTITGNIARDAFDAGIAGGNTSTILRRSVITNTKEGNIWVSLNCGTTLGEGGSNFQWPAKRDSGQNDTLCSAGVTFQNPLLGNVADNGCVTWTAKAAAGSPAANSGARCAAGSSPVAVLTYANGKVVPRGPFSLTFQQV